MATDYSKKITIPLILLVLAIISFFLLKPILLSIVVGILFAFIFNPVYKNIHKKIKSKNLSAGIICIFLIIILILPIWFLSPILINQSIKFYLKSQQVDFITPLKNVFPSLFASEEFSAEIGSILQSSTVDFTNYLASSLSKIILNFPTIALQSVVAFFTFFFILRSYCWNRFFYIWCS